LILEVEKLNHAWVLSIVCLYLILLKNVQKKSWGKAFFPSRRYLISIIVHLKSITMKKVLLMLVAAVSISTSMISCKKCGTCSTTGSVEYCQKDNETAYDLAKSTCENAGGTWNTD
jgi:hypothetical protein